jgi:hypothetical protein
VENGVVLFSVYRVDVIWNQSNWMLRKCCVRRPLFALGFGSSKKMKVYDSGNSGRMNARYM